jgi:hypothetical protein
MKNRWIINIVLLLVVAGLAAFLYLRPKSEVQGLTQYEVSTYKLAEFNQIQVDFPARSQVVFSKVDHYWHLKAPLQARADQASVHRILSIIAAKTTTKITPKNGQTFDAQETAKYGLDQPAIRLYLIRDDKQNQEEFLFGTFNPVTDEQYVAHRQAVYLLPVSYSEAASTQVIELVDKKPLRPNEKIAGFDFARLEQWEETRLNLDLVDGQWKVSIEKAKPTQNELNEWLDFSWKQATARSVEQYKPDPRQKYPSFEVKTTEGKMVHFDKMQESPELLLARPDEGLIYHFGPDEGFTMLNPPINLTK